jgi:transposase, IS30 family
MINIAARPPEVDDRAVRGHWEGDLLIGTGNRSAIRTLGERSSG